MAWQVLAIWIIVIPVVVSFLRSEAQTRRKPMRHRYAAMLATRPVRSQLTPQRSTAPATPAPRTGGLSPSQRAFLSAMVKAD